MWKDRGTIETFNSETSEATFSIGQQLGGNLGDGDVVLLFGGLGAGKTLLTKGILDALDFDIDEVTSPSFTLVNLYRTSRFDIYHIDLWRLENSADIASAVGLEEIFENERAVVIIEWADRLGGHMPGNNTVKIIINGDGDRPRKITIEWLNNNL